MPTFISKAVAEKTGCRDYWKIT